MDLIKIIGKGQASMPGHKKKCIEIVPLVDEKLWKEIGRDFNFFS